MALTKKARERQAIFRQMLLEIHKDVIEVSDKLHTLDLVDAVMLSVAENVSTTQLNQINISLRNRLRGGINAKTKS